MRDLAHPLLDDLDWLRLAGWVVEPKTHGWRVQVAVADAVTVWTLV